jgi:hypothetical protein
MSARNRHHSWFGPRKRGLWQGVPMTDVLWYEWNDAPERREFQAALWRADLAYAKAEIKRVLLEGTGVMP